MTAETSDPGVAVGSPESIAELLEAARTVQANSYSPYSRYAVGAAVRAASGRVYTGANWESAAFPQGVCAEGGAISAMVTAGETKIIEVLTVTPGTDLGTCCGGCRQKLREFAAGDVLIHAANDDGVVRTFTLDELLPASFGPENLPH